MFSRNFFQDFYLIVRFGAILAAPLGLMAKPVISEFMADNTSVYRGSMGTYEDWIELFNSGSSPVNLEGYYLTDDSKKLTKWKLPPFLLAPGQFIVISATGAGRGKNQINEDDVPFNGFDIETGLRLPNRINLARTLSAGFKLDTKGEYLALVKPDGKTVVHEYKPQYPAQKTNVSYGIVDLKTGRNDLKEGFLLIPTPGRANSGELLGFLPKVKISQARGYYESPFSVPLTCRDSEANIRYTLDGSAPNSETGKIYTGPFEISSTTVLRAAAFREGYRESDPATSTYLFLKDVVNQSRIPPEGYPQNGFVNSQILRFGMLEELVNEVYSPAEVAESLKALPSLCISTAPDNLFGAKRGIYANSYRKGKQWERPASLELMNPDGSKGFQVDAGLRVRGGYSRRPRNPKHAMRMVFRKEYGAGKLKFPLFGEEGTDEFDHIDFRTSLNYSWADNNSSWNNLLRDVWSRDTQREMGQPYTRSRFYHLFLNGLYWGVYQTQERALASYAASYMGGDKADYDVIKTHGQIADGNNEAYIRLYQETVKGFDDDDRYFRAQGLNPDGSSNPEYERLLDVDNLIDYMAVTYYTGDRDGPGSRYTSSPNNYYAIYNRKNPDGWKFFEHDSEHSMDTGDEDMTYPLKPCRNARYFNPHWLHDQLVVNKHYLKRFQQRLDQHFGVDGVLTKEKALQRLEGREQELKGGIKAHAARWGSVDRNFETWGKAVKRTKDWMDDRIARVYDQLRERGWYPGPKAPILSLSKGLVSPGFPVYLTASGEGETIYYTTDGTDPRGRDGKPTATAKVIGSAKVKTRVLLAEGAPVKALVPTDGDLGLKWVSPDFDETFWMEGTTPVGYEGKTGYEDLIALNLMDRMKDKNTSLYMRQEYELQELPAPEGDLFLRVKFDDGFIAYLNGTEIARVNAPNRAAWDSTATSDHSDASAIIFEDLFLTDAPLEKGRNVLALHAMDGEASSDFLMSAQIESRTYEGEAIKIDQPRFQLMTRAFKDDLWSGLKSAAYYYQSQNPNRRLLLR